MGGGRFASTNAPVQTDIVTSVLGVAALGSSWAGMTMILGAGAVSKVKLGMIFMPPLAVTGLLVSATV